MNDGLVGLRVVVVEAHVRLLSWAGQSLSISCLAPLLPCLACEFAMAAQRVNSKISAGCLWFVRLHRTCSFHALVPLSRASPFNHSCRPTDATVTCAAVGVVEKRVQSREVEMRSRAVLAACNRVCSRLLSNEVPHLPMPVPSTNTLYPEISFTPASYQARAWRGAGVYGRGAERGGDDSTAPCLGGFC